MAMEYLKLKIRICTSRYTENKTKVAQKLTNLAFECVIFLSVRMLSMTSSHSSLLRCKVNQISLLPLPLHTGAGTYNTNGASGASYGGRGGRGRGTFSTSVLAPMPYLDIYSVQDWGSGGGSSG